MPFLSHHIRGTRNYLTSLVILTFIISEGGVCGVSLQYSYHLSFPLLSLVFGTKLQKLNLTLSWEGGRLSATSWSKEYLHITLFVVLQ